MKRLVVMMLIAFLATGCNGQQESKSVEKKLQTDKKNGTQNQPKVSWDVKKQTDDEGNIIKYDSTYVWSYTNMEGDSMAVGADSLMHAFHSYFNENFPMIWDQSFTRPLWEDSLFYRDFYQEDYFHNRWQQDFFEMGEMFKGMDSLRNQFLYDQYPGLLIPPKEDKKADSN